MRRKRYKRSVLNLARDVLRANPAADKTALARRLKLCRSSIIRLARRMREGRDERLARCSGCGAKLLREDCLACRVGTS